MKNRFTAAAAALMLVLSGFSACSSSEENTIVTSDEEEFLEIIDDEELLDDIFADDEAMKEEAEIDLEEYFPDVPDAGDTDGDNGSGDDSSEEIADEPGGESSNPLRPLADAAAADSEWPILEEVTDPVIISEFFTLDASNENYRGLIIMQSPMSASMSEIIIIEAEDIDSAKADLDARRTKAIETDAWYPHDKELAEASIVDTNGSYAYFIIGENAEAAEASINAYING